MAEFENRNKKNKRTAVSDVAAPCIIGAFFCFLFLYFGVGQYPDSSTYIGYNTTREPLYPLFLKACRLIAGEGHFLWAAALLQNVIAFFSYWYLYRFVVRQFDLSLLFRSAALLVILAPHLFTSVFTPSGIVLTNAILSEGLTISLYPLFATLLLEAFYREKKGRYLAASYLTAFTLSLARGQLMPLFLVWFLVAAAAFIRSAAGGGRQDKTRRLTYRPFGFVRSAVGRGGQEPERHAKRVCGVLLALLIATAFGFVLRQAAMRCYHGSMTDGIVRSNTGGNVTLLTNVLYSAGEQAVTAAGEDLSERDAFYLHEIYAKMQERGLCASDAGSGFHARILHHEDSHDKIKFEIVGSLLGQGVQEEWGALPQGTKDGLEMPVDEDNMAGRLMKAVLPHSMGSFFWTYLYVAAGGFVRTVSLLSPVFSVYALLIYAAALALMGYLFRKPQGRAAAWFMGIVLLMTAANVCATALTIMCLSRYMIYNMTLFYLAGLVCVFEVVRGRKKPDEIRQ